MKGTRPASIAGTTSAGRTVSRDADARVDAPRDAARVRPLRRRLRRTAVDAWRRRLADERPRAAPHAAARLRLLLGRPRRVSAPAGVARRADPLPAVSDDAADARRADRHRTASPRTTSPTHLLERTGAAATRTDTCSRCTRSSRAGGCAACSISCSPDGRRRAGRSDRVRDLHEAVEPLALPRCETALAVDSGPHGHAACAR